MYDHARDGFTATFHAIPYVVGGLAALALLALNGLLIDFLIGTIQKALRPYRLRRAWARSGRTTPR